MNRVGRAGELARGFPDRLARLARHLSSAATPLAFAFDIDGVLLRGSKKIPQAPEALRLLNQHRVPWIMLTNGGGKKEADRIAELSARLDGIDIAPGQFLQSHTPFRDLVSKYKRVLVVGGDGDRCRHVAKSYGFDNVVMAVDIVAKDPAVWPFHRFHASEIKSWHDPNVDVHGADNKIDAVLVFCDSRDLGTDTQVVLDLLMSDNGRIGTRRSVDLSAPAIPIHFSNQDLLWSNDYPLSRFGQGAFKATVHTLYRECTGFELESHTIGKPTRYTYEYAEGLLKQLLLHKGDTQSPTVYMVGDNPASDIIGAHNFGWNSVLVRTGVYKDGAPLSVTPTSIENNVLDAVKYGLSQHGVV